MSRKYILFTANMHTQISKLWLEAQLNIVVDLCLWLATALVLGENR